MKSLFYFTLKSISSIVIRFYFRGIEVNGKENIPTNGEGFIYAANHQNAFLDAMIIACLSPRKMYFLTRASVFNSKLKWILEMMNMMPIYRIRDGYANLSQNEDIFHTCSQLIEKGYPVLLFPEGNHGEEYFLRDLTKGIARIALNTKKLTKEEIYVVPVGINYFNHFYSGHKLVVNFGQTYPVSESEKLYQENKNKGYKDLIQNIDPLMRDTLVIPNDSDNYPVQKPIFNRSNESLNFHQLRYEVSSKFPQKRNIQYPFLRHLGTLLELFNLLPFLLIRFVLKTKVKERIFMSSLKVAAGILVFPLWFLLSFLIATLFFNLKFALILLFIQLASLILRRELVRFHREIY